MALRQTALANLNRNAVKVAGGRRAETGKRRREVGFA